jgi:hypothetical protein
MKIRKDIVANFNRQIDWKIKEARMERVRFVSKLGFMNHRIEMENRMKKLAEIKAMFNSFSETGELLIP